MKPAEYSYAFNSFAPSTDKSGLGPYQYGPQGPNQLLVDKHLPVPLPMGASGLQGSFVQRKFTPDERLLIKKVLANIVNFMEEDGRTPEDVFGKYDYARANAIALREAETALFDDLFIEPDANCNLFLEYYTEPSGRIGLKQLYVDLERFKKARINQKQFDLGKLQSRLNANPIASMSKEKLVGYTHGMTDKDYEARMRERVEKIKDFFYLSYG
jgi:hypothetical protein